MRRRYDRRLLFALPGVFVAAATFAFLNQSTKIDVDAASLEKFDPGYIISDYTMGNYKSMTEKQIQEFLTSKNSCSNKDKDLYDDLVATWGEAGYTWNFKEDHFVCLSEELFGDGEVIGEGETAAHIIWQAAQDYQINPQVLLVLLQKETGLITDPYPNNRDYRKATGYGCPDTAACSEKYYGFKNQIRNAASLFHGVLSGGWTNYPLGTNYIQYNPNKDCGGSEVNIRNLATSALYRYTPYQPNPAAIKAGYGTASCGAYGNRNFYLYFEDWFGGITKEGATVGEFKAMSEPRLLSVKAKARYIDVKEHVIKEESKQSFQYFTTLSYSGDTLCLSVAKDSNCYIYEDLEEIKIGSYTKMDQARMLLPKKDAKYFDLEKKNFDNKTTVEDKIVFEKKTYINNQLCLIPKDNKDKACILYSSLEELSAPEIKDMVVPRYLYTKTGSKRINLKTGITELTTKEEKFFYNKLGYWFGKLCLQRKDDNGTEWCVLYEDALESKDEEVEKMQVARFLLVKKDAKIVNITTGSEKKTTEDAVYYFDKKIMINGKLCLQSPDTKINSKGQCVMYDGLEEIDNFQDMEVPRSINVVSGSKYYDLQSKKAEEAISDSKLFFDKKIYLNNKDLCLATKNDTEKHVYRCVKYTDLKE